jgi:hypothetical protein
MPEYRLFCLHENGDVAASYWIDAKSDQEALFSARLLRVKRLGAELWRDARLVGRLNANGDLETLWA